ncbi:hypothetical protein [Desulfotruncus alcoholivorax]|uniref:hypothetical protein n=1 Tax=Desulfotruncus alcoholivorax TaxID=265477 RepID=UPI000422A623|nr:hypothetical protein [Desulfotruncus alcoholivorax]
MRSQTLLPMSITVFLSVFTYYLLSTWTSLSENKSMAAGVLVAILCSGILKRISDRKHNDSNQN